MSDENKTLVENWFEFSPGSDIEAILMLYFSTIFENFVLETNNEKTGLEYITQLIQNFEFEYLYQIHLLKVNCSLPRYMKTLLVWE